MKKIYYNKLVRDNIQKLIEEKGETCEMRAISDNEEFKVELLKKVIEEANGLAHSRTKNEFLNQYADLMTVMDALLEQMEITDEEVQNEVEKNIDSKGLFENKCFLNWSTDSNYSSGETPQGLK